MKDQVRHIAVLLVFAMMVNLNIAMEIIKSMRANGKAIKDSGTTKLNAKQQTLPGPRSSGSATKMMGECSCSGAIDDEETPVPGSPSVGPATIMVDKKRKKLVLKSHMDGVFCNVVNQKTNRPILKEVELKKDKLYPLNAELDEKIVLNYKWTTSPKLGSKPVKLWLSLSKRLKKVYLTNSQEAEAPIDRFALIKLL
ncbi:hypothetical protein PGT21_005587 [Puccinia graminis f. sp. tritici]|uniref:Uncharacterized protein n=1 Tax=Puccinia graminis f. sp. tritici TaxID=56615 RepID=A0A5B0LUF1_PUCGR|nr:hypothetical protein PGT21_005587 [Puccinia graminis f. sp. tritici]KAA1137777.1 hypothetical protein PGTUg99_016415 [Puccinia graminis f. sp. tritici]